MPTYLSQYISQRVGRAIEERVFPGCVVGVFERGERIILPFGSFTYEVDSERVQKHSIYDVASITKSIPTASLALHLIGERRLRLSDTVHAFLPELKNHRGATVKDLLTYTVRGLQLSTLKDNTAEDILAHVFECGFFAPPGKPEYTNLPALLLGLIVERVSKETLNALSQRIFFDPLHMTRTTFSPSFAPSFAISFGGRSKASEGRPSDVERCVPTEIIEGNEIRGIVHDESARVFARARKAVGHAGLFSTADDILTFLEALIAGTFPAVVRGAQEGLGWQLADERFMGKDAGKRTFGKTGFTGTSVVCDVERGIALVILSNRTYPKRPPNDDAIYAFRRDIADIVLGAR